MLLLLSTARPSCGCELGPMVIVLTAPVAGFRKPMRALSESSNQTSPLLSVAMPEICVPGHGASFLVGVPVGVGQIFLDTGKSLLLF